MKAYYFPDDYDIWSQKASKGERAFYDQSAALGFIPSHGEAQAIEDRKWRFDFLFDWADLIVEIGRRVLRWASYAPCRVL